MTGGEEERQAKFKMQYIYGKWFVHGIRRVCKKYYKFKYLSFSL